MSVTVLSYKEVAQDIGVSEASVRNWVKCGYLTTNDNNFIYKHSVTNFKANIAGKEKLVARANKSQFDRHDHAELSESMLREIKSEELKGEEQSALYEDNLSKSYKNKEGIFYTPSFIAADFFKDITFPVADKTFCDPCCGSGNFIIAAIDAGFNPDNIYGYDVDEIAVEIAKKRVFEKTGKQANIEKADFLQLVQSKKSKTFDVIFTNPPWGKKISKDQKLSLSANLSAGKSMDTCSLFMVAALAVTKENGIVGMLLPESFFNVASFSDVRSKILSYNILSMKDYGRAFKGLLTKAKTVTLQKSQLTKNNVVQCIADNIEISRSQESFNNNPNSIFNFSISNTQQNVIENIQNIPHTNLFGQAQWGLGIVTGNNSRFIKAAPEEGYMPVYRGSDIYATYVSSPQSYIPEDLSLYQQTAPMELYNADSKLIYRFISSRLVFFHDTERRQILNSANLLIPHKNFPIAPKVLADYLSSDFVNWFFQSVFDTHKILRSDIEKIPIFHEFLNLQNEFDETELLHYLKLTKDDDGTFRIRA